MNVSNFSYLFIEEQCGGTLKSFNGTLTTPSYPNDYPPNTVCTWIIKADSKHQVKLVFQSFNIEKHESCLYDKLSIRDGENSKSKIISEACGDVRPGTVISKTGSLWIRFSSDESNEMTGFSANWQFLAKSGQMGKFRMRLWVVIAAVSTKVLQCIRVTSNWRSSALFDAFYAPLCSMEAV